MFLDLCDGQLAVVEERSGERRVRARALKHLGKVVERTAAARGDDRDGRDPADCVGQLEIKARFRAVLVHRGQQNFARAALVGLLRPGDRVNAGRRAAARHIHLKAALGHAGAARVDRDNDALTAVALGRRVQQAGVAHSGRIDRNLIRARAQNLLEILDRADAAAHGDRDEDLPAGAAHHVRDGRAVVARRGDVQKDDLVRALRRVELGQLDRVARVAQADEVNALDHPAVLDVQTGNDSFRQHQPFASSIARLRSSAPV